jgi:dipeptidyl aminopeptidase/acylaminoacyl peptidase
MTTRERFEPASPEFDRLMTAWFDAEARVREPDDLLARALARTSRVRPLPAWLLPERWIPMQLTMRRRQLPRALPYFALLMVLALLAAVAVAIVGTASPVPTPFGPAGNGVLVYVTSAGDIATVDPVTGVSRTIVGGPDRDLHAVVSLDGTRVGFVRPVEDGVAVYVADIDGGGVRRLTDAPLPDATAIAWSPDGQRVAFQSSGRLWIANTDGSGAHAAPMDLVVDNETIRWRPPDGEELLVRGIVDGRAGLFLTDRDGRDPRVITPLDGGEYDYLWATWSPDGKRVAYHRVPAYEIHILTIGSAQDMVIHPDGDPGMLFPRFSPDGTRLAVMVWDGTSPDFLIGVLRADDPAPSVTLTGPIFTDALQFDWAPDGESILAVQWNTEAPWILDPAGGRGQQASWSVAVPDWVEWQRLAH